MLVGFIGLKGGVGKTSLSLATAACAQDDGRSSLLIDLDPSGLAGCWRPEGFFGCVSWPRDAAEGVRGAAAGVDVACVDVATGDTEVIGRLAAVVDVLVIPCLPSPLDVQVCAGLLEHLEAAGMTDRTQVRVLLNRVDLRTSLGRRARSDLEAAGFPMLQTVVPERVAMSDALARGLPPSREDARLRATLRELSDELSALPTLVESTVAVTH